jgi:ATP-binding cassette subfamily F protein 3
MREKSKEKVNYMLLDIQHIYKSYKGTDILKDACFHIEEKEKAAVIGINGAGKTTLLRIIMGEEEPDSGMIVKASGRTIGYLAQHQDFESEGTVYQSVFNVNSYLLSLEEAIRSSEKSMAALTGDELSKAMNEYSRISEEFERLNGFAYRSTVVGILKGLGFTEEDFPRKASLLSGGEKTRLALGRILLSDPDMIILDEPTNHLDIESVSWLENYLRNYTGAVLIVSHDRYFLNRIVTKIIEIDNSSVNIFKGNYDDYSYKKAQLRSALQSAYFKAQRKIAHEEKVIEKLKQFNREKSIKRAESREKKLERIEVIEKPVDANDEIRLSLTPRKTSGNDVLTVCDLSKAYSGVTLFDDVSINIFRGEHVCIIGSNGTGKSTLLKIINGITVPDKGEIITGANVVIGYYDQEYQNLHMDKTIFDEISDNWPDMDNTKIRNILASFLFTGEDVFKYIRDLSGGERARVSLANLMLSEANFLILDEPTNHLDIVSKEILENAINNYSGTVLCVSHDRYFVNKTATRILELYNNTFVDYSGNYDYYLEKRDILRPSSGIPDNAGEASSGKAVAEGDPSNTQAELSSKDRWLENKKMEAARRKLENDIKKVEKSIEELEDENASIDEMLSDISIACDHVKLRELTSRKNEIEDKLQELMNKWEELQQ